MPGHYQVRLLFLRRLSCRAGSRLGRLLPNWSCQESPYTDCSYQEFSFRGGFSCLVVSSLVPPAMVTLPVSGAVSPLPSSLVGPPLAFVGLDLRLCGLVVFVARMLASVFPSCLRWLLRFLRGPLSSVPVWGRLDWFKPLFHFLVHGLWSICVDMAVRPLVHRGVTRLESLVSHVCHLCMFVHWGMRGRF